MITSYDKIHICKNFMCKIAFCNKIDYFCGSVFFDILWELEDRAYFGHSSKIYFVVMVVGLW